MSFQTYESQYILSSGKKLLKPGQCVDFVATQDLGSKVETSLRIVGKSVYPAPFTARGETIFREFEYLIDDYLSDSVVFKQDYSLGFICEPGDYSERLAYNRFTSEALSNSKVKVSFSVKTDNLLVAEDGFFGVKIEGYLKKAGRNANDVFDAADFEINLPVESGSAEFRDYSFDLQLPEGAVTLLFVAGGRNFTGAAWMEGVSVEYSEGRHSMPFVPHAKRDNDMNYWVGQNLVSKCWPEWTVFINGEQVFSGKIFDRASNVADFFIPLDCSISKGDRITLRLEDSSLRKTFPYQIQSAQLLSVPAESLEIISRPRFVSAGSEFNLLLETRKDNLAISVETSDSIKPQSSALTLAKAGFHVLTFSAVDEFDSAPWIRVAGENFVQQFDDFFIIKKLSDSVYLSTGDEVYLDMNRKEYLNYFRWFFSEDIANFCHFRPSYQWSGSRGPEGDSLQKYLSVLQAMKMPYAWQAEGRTLAGHSLNPSAAQLDSQFFKGKQAHENDGGFYYWGHFKYLGLFSDIAARNRPYGGIFAKKRPIYSENGTFIHYNPYEVKTMEEGAARIVSNFAQARGDSSRHTGPSTMFRYLYQAGYSWLGAEQMYGPEDIILASLRGASKAYGKSDYGTLHAMQWGGGGYKDPAHSRRFFLSLATAYINGSSHINTEEALWLDEYVNDRFSKSGQEHISAQKKMMDYIHTNSRQGKQVITTAFVQGRNDGWKCFDRSSIWSNAGNQWRFGDAERSFDLLNIFYPESVVNYTPAIGWFTTTPFGACDLLPIEAPLKVLQGYENLIFLGWNSFAAQDFQQILEYVSAGGNLLLSAAHLNTNGIPNDEIIPADSAVLKKLLGDDYLSAEGRRELTVGKGKVIFYANKVYPSNIEIFSQYKADIIALAQDSMARQRDSGWIIPGKKLNFSVYDSESMRTIYLLNTNWQSPNSNSTGIFQLGQSEFEISIPFGQICNIYASGNSAVMADNPTSQVLRFFAEDGRKYAEIQIISPDSVQLFDGEAGTVEFLQFDKPGIYEIEL
ncbi:MAG: hypothetical protein JXR63_02285 [Spirochaetales bacterium]|nr:hypothetical protein [Spirochaetales bacterium]